MAKRKTTISEEVSTPFFHYLWSFYAANKGIVRRHYKELTTRILDFNDPENAGVYLRRPQYEAFEMYVFLKEYLDNPRLADLLDDWRNNRGRFQLRNTTVSAQPDMFKEQDASAYDGAFERLNVVRQDYANYIFALTMGVGKTVLMALCIYYEFILARKFPSDPRFCHNAIVFAPDTTVLQSLKEIQDLDKTRILPAEYVRSLDAEVKFHFLEEAGVTLNTLDRSSFNVVISNTQKIIRKRRNAAKSAADRLFSQASWDDVLATDPNADLYALDDESDLSTNQRFQKLARLHQLGIYVDEAHHAFGAKLKKDMADHASKTSLRLTIDSLSRELEAAGTRVVACYNFTGTPYVENELMPEVVYAFSLKDAINHKYLKTAMVEQVKNAKSKEFIRNAIGRFAEEHGERRYEGMLPKMAIFAATIEELENELKPAVEDAVERLGLPLSSVLVNVGDDKLTTADDIREFRLLDTKESDKRFILLVGKGKEGWNCRSLFSVALFRQPKSRIFVLQATMRCLRSITTEQQRGRVFLSEENYQILKDELEANFRLSMDEFQSRPDSGKERVIVRVRKPPVFIEVSESRTLYNLSRKEPADGFSLGLSGLDASAYRVTSTQTDLRDIESAVGASRELRGLGDDLEYSRLTLVAELARYFNMSPLELEDILDRSEEGVDGVLAYVNESNRILYEVIIPRLFKTLFTVDEYKGKKETVLKALVKDPPDGDEGYEITVDPDLFADEAEPEYAPFSRKSFHLSGYGFDSRPELEFFRRNLPNERIKNIWFTGMLTAGQTDFFIHYIDPDTNALRSYYPDFLMELEDGGYLIAEVKGEHMIDAPVTLAKQRYAEEMALASKMRYVLIPSATAAATSIGSL